MLAFNNTKSFVQMSSLSQKRVLLGLQAGLKLREVLQEPHMPSLRMLDEWLTNPEYHAAYLAAMDTGQNYRAKQMANRPVAPAPKLATEMDKPEPELKVVLPPTVNITYMNPAPTCPVPAAADIAKLEPLIDDAFYAQMTPLTIDDDTLKQLLMQRLRAGEYSSKMVDNTPGFYADKLTKWRKDADFVVEWNKAQAIGRDKRKSLPSPAIETVASVSPFLVVEPVVSSHIVIPPPPLPIYEAPCGPAPDPALEYLPEGLVRRFVVLKAEECYDFLMSEKEARAIAAEDTARTGQPHYVSEVISVAAMVLTPVLHPIA